MKKNRIFQIAVATQMVTAALLVAAPSDVRITDLRCEYLKDPLGVGTALPRFSWKLVDPDFTRGQKQTAYRVVVRDALNPDSVLWDTGKVDSSESVNVEYAGTGLTSGQDCLWQVRIWDQEDNPSAWNAQARFSVGLLKPSDWKGDWIAYKEADNIKHIWHRKNFTLKHVPQRAFLYLCSIGYHELYVNGKRQGTQVLTPSVTNLEKRGLYVTYDITDALQPGDNVIAVWTGPGWARASGSFGKTCWEQRSIFKCQVNLSEGTSFHSDRSWKCKVSSSENLGLWKGGGKGEYGGEIVDARRHIPDWNTATYDDSEWVPASAFEKSAILTAAMLEPDRKVETLSPVSIRGNDGVYTVDMGRNFTGWLEMDLRGGKEGNVVTFTTANQPGKAIEFKQESRYIFDETGTGTFGHRFNYMAGRWITISGLSYQPNAKDIRCYIVTNDRKRIGDFSCSSALLSWIYEADLRTYIANTVNGVLMDCPHRERYGYGEIAFACAWGCGIPNYESAAFYTKNARDWFDVQLENGFVNTIAPQVYKGAGGTLWSSAPVTVTWELYKAFGDKRQLAEAYDPMKKWLDFLNGSISEEGVLVAYDRQSRFLGDWATPHGSEYGGKPEAKLFNNCVYAYILDVFVKAARALDRDDDAQTYAARLAALRKNAHKKFFNEEAKNYIDGRQLSMAFPLYTRITPETEREAVFKNLVDEIVIRKPYLDTGSPGLPILLKYIIEDVERPDLLYPALARLEHPGYGYFFTRGETTWPEYWKIDGINSRIHTCYTSIAGYFIKAVGGIRPDPAHPGMQRFIVKPNLVGDLTWASTHSGSMYGRITSHWKRKGAQGTFHIEVPPNSTATVHLPAKRVEDVREGGIPLDQAEGVTPLRASGDYVSMEVASGVYHFTSSSVVRQHLQKRKTKDE